MARGSKRVETRSWSTPYRGPLAIHAAKRKVLSELIFDSATWHWCGVFGVKIGGARLDELLPFGAIVAVGDLVDCRPTGSFTVDELDAVRMPPGETLDLYGWTERKMGDFTPGRFGWVFENLRALPEPIPYRGAQGFFNVPDDLFSML